MSALNIGGINLNAVVSMVLDPLHKIEPIQLLRYSHNEIDDEGNTVNHYLPPIALEAQIQDPDASKLEHVRHINQNPVHRQFWVNYPISPIDRNTGRGGDIILYDGYRWHVTGQPDEFNKQGWTSVIAERLLDDSEGD